MEESLLNTGDTAWVLTSAALVLLMLPGLALFYGGMTRSKSTLNMMMMVFGATFLVGVLWVIFGYSITFGTDGGSGFWGNPTEYLGLESLMTDDPEAALPAMAFVAFQAMFAAITVALIVGAFAERTKFSAVLIFAVLWFMLNKTAWGRHVYAVGDDPEAAELAGVQTKRVLIQVYALAGLFCAIAGWVMIGRFGSVSPTASTGQLGNIQSITAVVIGGISLFGGRGSIVGMFFGALIVGVFEMGLKMVGTDPQWTFFLIGLLIILAVAVDQWIRKAAA